MIVQKNKLGGGQFAPAGGGQYKSAEHGQFGRCIHNIILSSRSKS